MTAQFGAHEVMEVHEVLSSAINAINQCQLYRPHVQDQHLASMKIGRASCRERV